MPYSPILVGDRIAPPAYWTRTLVNQTTSRALNLIPATTNVISYPTTWHHNIPWKTLRDSWNLIYTFFSSETVETVFNLYATSNGTVHKYDKLFRAINEIKVSVGPTLENAPSGTCNLWMSRLKEEGGQLGHLEVSKQMTADQRENLRSIVAWQKWNIVEGPKESVRVEDPGSDDFDDFRFVDPLVYDRFQKVYLYFEALEALIRRFTALGDQPCDLKTTIAAEEKLFKGTLDKVQTLAHLPLVSFNTNHWKVVQYGGRGTATVDGQVYSLVAKKNI